MKLILYILSSLAFVFSLEAQFTPIKLYPFPYEPLIRPRFKLVPYVSGPSAHFVYLEEGGDGSQNIRLARMIDAYPDPIAEPMKLLVTEDGLGDSIVDLIASPDNKWLAVYTFQDFGTGFVDHNFTFYDMATGDLLGFVNEHSFSELDEFHFPSERLEEFKEIERTEFEVPEEVLDGYDYSVVTEGANIMSPTYGWNSDGSFRLTFNLDVLSFGFFIGNEEFSKNYSMSPAAINFMDYGPKPSAVFPSVFSLTPVGGPTELVRFEGRTVKMRIEYSFTGVPYFVRYFTFNARMTEGNIPIRRRVVLHP